VGDRLQHEKFGIGTVVQVQESKGDQILTIAFPGEGVKKLMAGFAPLLKVD
jgi:DNA helicase-2/ATP-dependent DNA helicase PcrA